MGLEASVTEDLSNTIERGSNEPVSGPPLDGVNPAGLEETPKVFSTPFLFEETSDKKHYSAQVLEENETVA